MLSGVLVCVYPFCRSHVGKYFYDIFFIKFSNPQSFCFSRRVSVFVSEFTQAACLKSPSLCCSVGAQELKGNLSSCVCALDSGTMAELRAVKSGGG